VFQEGHLLKIVFAGASADVYGADAVLRHIAAHMHRSGDSCVVVLPEEGPARKAAEDAGLPVKIAVVPVLRRADVNIRGLAALAVAFVRGSLAIRRLLRRERPDLLWVNTITIPLWALIGRFLRLRVICHSHEIVGSAVWLRRLLYLPLFLVERVVVVSEASRTDIVRAYPALAQRICVVTNPSFTIQSPVPVMDGGECAIVLLGRVSPRKGHDVMIKALREPPLASLHPVVHVCGASYRSPEAQRFAREIRAEARSLSTDVVFHGFVSTSDALAKGAIVVVPSREPDPCPLVLAEALTAGRAIVASDCGGIPELAGGAVLLVPPNDPAALARALASLLVNSDERERMTAASLLRARSLTPERYFEEIERCVRPVGA
jgi:glycosyltransferase involved in cell wall biosynthesis